MEPTHRLVLCTCPDQECALGIGERVVEERLAACVSVLPGVTSIFRWEGQLQRETEVMLLIKTSGEVVDALATRLRQLHPYVVPEIIALPITGGLPDYLSWVTQCTTTET